MSSAAQPGFDVTQRIAIWPSAMTQLHEWEKFIVTNKPVNRPPQHVTSGIVLYTDASNMGMGAVLFQGDGTMQVVARRWTALERSRDICERETMAVTEATHKFRAQLQGTSFQLHIDNTSSMWAIARGYARSYNLNNRVRELQEVLRGLDARWTIHYVASHMNPADTPSRMFTQLSSPLRVLDGQKMKVTFDYPLRNGTYAEVARRGRCGGGSSHCS